MRLERRGRGAVALESEVMAKITYNPAVQHLHGAVGNMVFKQQSGRDVVASKPDHVNQPNTPAQLQQRENFRQAAAYAKNALADAQLGAAYSAKAKADHSTPIAEAVKDWMTPPEVTAIDLSHYNKHVGDVIFIAAQDDFEVTGVTVAIEDNAHAPLEGGAAMFDAASGGWKYVATTDASAKPGVTVTATAQDRPGNTGTLTATK